MKGVFFAFFVVVLAAVAGAEPKGRVIILGFDGVDPDLAAEMMDRGELPHLARLRDQGTFQPLASSNPPQSPTAWSSFATCRNPLNHGIFDFLRRDPEKYRPAVGFGSSVPPVLNPDGSLAERAKYVSNKKGINFWKAASDQGLKVKALIVPFAYPADDLGEECRQLCGLDVPDIRGTQSTYFALAESFAKEESVAGGMRLPLRFNGESASAEVPGIRIPNTRDFAKVPLKVTVDRAAKRATLEIQGAAQTVEEGAWSPWMEWTFTLSPKYDVRAVSRFHVMSAGDSVRLYMTCLQIHPNAPFMRISTPDGYAGEIAAKRGLYKTIGWTYDTKALEQGDMTNDMFLDDIQTSMAWKEQLILDEIDAGGFDLLLGATTATDRVGHMFWAHRDPKHPGYTAEGAAKYGRAVETTYIRMDETVGKVMERLKPEDLLMVMSDHGFHSFRRQFSVNTWLIRNGYLAVQDQPDAATAFTDQKFVMPYDWSKSKAYGLGLGMIFLNLQGREANGIVPRAAARDVAEEIRMKLLQVTDPATGDKVFSEIYLNVNPKGEAVKDAPDLQLGYAEGFQTDKASAAGAAPKDVFSDNDNTWSGEHASSDPAITAGILFANRALDDKAAIIDLGVTALDYLGAKSPAEFEGRSLLPK